MAIKEFQREEELKVTEVIRSVNIIHIEPLHVAPGKPRDGDIVLADGTDWDPGSGAGFYGRYGSAWVKLG